MPAADVNLATIDRHRVRLVDQFGRAPIYQRHDRPDAEVFEEWIELSEAGYIGSAYALIRRPPERLPPLTESFHVDGEEAERILLILGRGGSQWGVPGGGQEGSESMAATARREIREEVGLEVSLTDLHHMRHEISTCEGSDERLHVLRVFFHAKYEDGSIAIQPGELNGAAWFADPPQAEQLMPSTRRLLETWQAE